MRFDPSQLIGSKFISEAEMNNTRTKLNTVQLTLKARKLSNYRSVAAGVRI